MLNNMDTSALENHGGCLGCGGLKIECDNCSALQETLGAKMM